MFIKIGGNKSEKQSNFAILALGLHFVQNYECKPRNNFLPCHTKCLSAFEMCPTCPVKLSDMFACLNLVKSNLKEVPVMAYSFQYACQILQLNFVLRGI